ncbi:hypothetical protein GEMRC1_002878 [Eukaryota sp. GEM-RC1]
MASADRLDDGLSIGGKLSVPPCLLSFNEKFFQIISNVATAFGTVASASDTSQTVSESGSYVGSTSTYDRSFQPSESFSGAPADLPMLVPVSDTKTSVKVNFSAHVGSLSISLCSYKAGKLTKFKNISNEKSKLLRFPEILNFPLSPISVHTYYSSISQEESSPITSLKLKLCLLSEMSLSITPEILAFALDSIPTASDSSTVKFVSTSDIRSQIKVLKSTQKATEKTRRKDALKGRIFETKAKFECFKFCSRCDHDTAINHNDVTAVGFKKLSVFGSSTLSDSIVSHTVTSTIKEISLSVSAPNQIFSINQSASSLTFSTTVGFFPLPVVSGVVLLGKNEINLSLPNLALISSVLHPWMTILSKKNLDYQGIENSEEKIVSEETESAKNPMFVEVFIDKTTIKSDLGPEIGNLKFSINSIRSHAQLLPTLEEFTQSSAIVLFDSISLTSFGCLSISSQLKSCSLVSVKNFSSPTPIPKLRMLLSNFSFDTEFEVVRILFCQFSTLAFFSAFDHHSSDLINWLVIDNFKVAVSSLTTPSLFNLSKKLSNFFETAKVGILSELNFTPIENNSIVLIKPLNAVLPSRFTLVLSNISLNLFTRSLRDSEWISLLGEEVSLSFSQTVIEKVEEPLIVQRQIDLLLVKNELSKLTIRNSHSDDVSVRLSNPHVKFLVRIPGTEVAFCHKKWNNVKKLLVKLIVSLMVLS